MRLNRARQPGYGADASRVVPAGTKNKVVAKGRAGKRGKRLKEPLLKVLKAAGSSGITVKELAAKLKVKPGNVFSWFYTTGKKIKGISKVGEAKYAYSFLSRYTINDGGRLRPPPIWESAVGDGFLRIF